MDTNKLIASLTADLKPVRPLPSIGKRLTAWILAVIALNGIILGWTGISRFGSLSDFVLVLFIALTAGYAALRSSVPGEENKRLVRYMPVALMAVWFGVTLLRWTRDPAPPDLHLICAGILTAGGLAGLFAIRALVRGAYPLQTGWTGMLSGLAAAAGIMIGVSLLCLHAHPAHVMAWHIGPVLVFVGLGFLLKIKMEDKL